MYINTLTNRYPMSEDDVRAECPNVSFPVPFQAPDNYAVVTPSPSPTVDLFSRTLEGTPVNNNGVWTQTWTIVSNGLTLDAIKQQQLATVDSLCEQAFSVITAGYPDSEISSWPKQETEARAWLADNTSATPLIDTLCSIRGIDKATLVSRIISLADSFAVMTGKLVGNRQRLYDAIKAASDNPTLLAIDITAGWSLTS